MERKLRLGLWAISVALVSSFIVSSQILDDEVLGRYCIPNNVKNRVVEDYSVEFYPNHKFKYILTSSIYGCIVETQGSWSTCGDTIILDSQIEELSIEGMGYFEYPFEEYTFRVLRLENGSLNWFNKCESFNHFYFRTLDGDTLNCTPDDNGIISISKKIRIEEIWADNIYTSNKVHMPKDKDLNFFILKYSPYRQFVYEKWIFSGVDGIMPIDRSTKQYADYCLQRESRWDTSMIWEDPVIFKLRMIKNGHSMLNNHKLCRSIPRDRGTVLLSQ